MIVNGNRIVQVTMANLSKFTVVHCTMYKHPQYTGQFDENDGNSIVAAKSTALKYRLRTRC